MNVGIVPLSWFELRSKWTKPGMADNESGTDPEKEFEAKERAFREIKSPMEEGISPFSPLEERFKVSRLSNMVMEGGFEVGHTGKDNVGGGGFDGDIGESEVGEVNEEREGDSGDVAEAVDGGEGAERGGKLGREASGSGGGSDGAVEEVEGAESGERLECCEGERVLESWREVRWRKGVEMSQSIEGWEHGSLVVGMLRDWRAFICFGSRGGVTVMLIVGRRRKNTTMVNAAAFMPQRSESVN
ncbi:hypothetical protein CR513_56020, partial [Mucuna pruriens]